MRDILDHIQRTPQMEGLIQGVGMDEEATAGPGEGQVYLAAPHDPGLAGQVRAWAAQHGVRVMPPACDGLAAVASPRDGAAAARLP